MPEDISFLLLPGFSAIGFMSAVEPLRVANRFRGDLYRWRILSLDGAPVAASNGISINADAAIGDVEAVRTLFVVAGFEPLACYTRALGDRLKRLARAGATLGGIDTGSFVLAEAGLLGGSDSVTVHWEALSAFRERYPSLDASQELFEIGARRREEVDAFAASLGLALRHGGLERAHDFARQQRLERCAVAGGEGLDDHLIGRARAVQELADVEARVARLQRGQAGQRTGVFQVRLSGLGQIGGAGDGLRVRQVVGPPAHATAEHRVELEEHDPREGRQDDQFEGLHGRARMLREDEDTI